MEKSVIFKIVCLFADGFKFWLRENLDILNLRSFAVQLPPNLASTVGWTLKNSLSV